MRKLLCAIDFNTSCDYSQEELLTDNTLCVKCLEQQNRFLKDKLHRRNKQIKDLKATNDALWEAGRSLRDSLARADKEIQYYKKEMNR